MKTIIPEGKNNPVGLDVLKLSRELGIIGDSYSTKTNRETSKWLEIWHHFDQLAM